MPINLTERAAVEVRKYKGDNKIEEDTFLRVGATAGGCSGYSYRLEFDNAFNAEKDDQYECHGVKVVVDKKSQLLLDGTEIDWHESLEQSGFTFNNPNVVKSCGCGSSFQV